MHRFLPLARKHQIRVWVCLVPPSESPPHTKYYAEPFRLDYQRWAVELARLSVREPNLVAWSIDDFQYSLRSAFAPAQMRKILGAARAINPKLAFVPCLYFPAVTARFVRDYRGLFEGILFPYRHESAGANLSDASLVVEEVKRIKNLVGPSIPVIVDVYASGHSTLGIPRPNMSDKSCSRPNVRPRRARLLSPESAGIVGKVSHYHGALPRLVYRRPGRKAA